MNNKTLNQDSLKVKPTTDPKNKPKVSPSTDKKTNTPSSGLDKICRPTY